MFTIHNVLSQYDRQVYRSNSANQLFTKEVYNTFGVFLCDVLKLIAAMDVQSFDDKFYNEWGSILEDSMEDSVFQNNKNNSLVSSVFKYDMETFDDDIANTGESTENKEEKEDHNEENDKIDLPSEGAINKTSHMIQRVQVAMIQLQQTKITHQQLRMVRLTWTI